MAPTSALKRRKLSAHKGVGKTTKGVAGRKRAETDSESDSEHIATPYNWNKTNITKDKQTSREGQKKISTRASTVSHDTDTTSTTASEDEEEGSVEVLTRINGKTDEIPTTAGVNNRLSINTKDTIDTLQESVAKLEARNRMLASQIRNISKMGGVDKYELMQIRKMVKEDLFKRVKFITTTAMEEKCMKYLSNKLNVPIEMQREWSATYAHCVRDALNNKRNNVSQDLKMEIKGKQCFENDDNIGTTVTHMI